MNTPFHHNCKSLLITKLIYIVGPNILAVSFHQAEFIGKQANIWQVWLSKAEGTMYHRWIPSMMTVFFSREQGFPRTLFQLQSDLLEHKEVRLARVGVWIVTVAFTVCVNSFQDFEAIKKQKYINRFVNCFH